LSDTPQRVLIVRPSALGDVCRSVHVAQRVRRAFPGVRIDWLVQRGFEPVLAHHPSIDRLVSFDRRGLGRDLKRGKPSSLLRLLSELREARYDAVIDAQGLLRSALLARASGARRSFGFADAQEGARLLYRHRVAAARTLHAVERMDRLAAEAVRGLGGTPENATPDLTLHADAQEAAGLRQDPRFRLVPPIIIAPTSRWAGKRWPIDRFVELARRLLRAGEYPLAIVGAPNEREQCRPLLELAETDTRVVDLVGSINMERWLALLSIARVVVACDSAALHAAVGLGRPTVALFGPTRTDLVGPWQREHEVLQHLQGITLRPGDHKDGSLGRELMARITADEAHAAVVDCLRAERGA